MAFFDDLKASMQEAIEIKQGKRKTARVTRYSAEQIAEIRTHKLNSDKGRKPARAGLFKD